MRLSIVPATVTAALVLGGSMWVDAGYPLPELEPLRGDIFSPPVQSADSVPVAPWAQGAAAITSGVCRDSVVNGSWSIKRWVTTDTALSGTYPHFADVIRDSIDNYTDRWHWIFVTGGIKSVAVGSALQPQADGDQCVTIAGWSYTTGGGGDGPLLTWNISYIDSASIGLSAEILDLRDVKDWAVFGMPMAQGMTSSGVDVVSIAGESQRVFVSNSHLFYNGDELFSRTGGTNADTMRDLGLAYSIVGPASASKNLGGIIGPTSAAAGEAYVVGVSDYMNVWAENKWRNPRIGTADSLQIWSSVFHNWQAKIGSVTDGYSAGRTRAPRLEFVSNRWKPGPYMSGSEPRTYHIESGFEGDTLMPLIYLSGNLHDSIDGGSLSKAQRGEGGATAPGDSSIFTYESFNDSSPPDSAFSSTRLVTHSPHPMVARDTASVWDTLIVSKEVGRWSVMNCAGAWVDKRADPSYALADSVLTWVANGSSHSSHADHDEPTDYISGGWPTMTIGSVCADSDSDGIADSTELAMTGQGSSTSVAADSVSPSGYLMIEFANVIGAENAYYDSTLTAVLRDCAPGTACAISASATYRDNVYIYRSSSTAQDTICLDASGTVTTCPAADTVIPRTWNPDSIPVGGIGRACWDGDSVRYFLSESILVGGNLLDSVSADGFFVPSFAAGCDTATAKDTATIPN
jgi:hypothetical protein